MEYLFNLNNKFVYNVLLWKKIQVYEISNHCTLFIYVPIFVELGVVRDIWHNNFYKSLQAQPVHFPRTLLKHCFLLLTVSSVCETNRLFQLETVASESVLFCYILATELFLLTSLSTLWPKILWAALPRVWMCVCVFVCVTHLLCIVQDLSADCSLSPWSCYSKPARQRGSEMVEIVVKWVWGVKMEKEKSKKGKEIERKMRWQ